MGLQARSVPALRPALIWACTGATVAIAVAGLVGWFTDSSTLLTWFHGLPEMKVNAAVGLILAAVAVVLVLGADRSKAARRGAMALGLAVAAAGLLSALEHALDRDVISGLLVDVTTADHPGRPPAQAAIALSLCGVAITAVASGCGRWATRVYEVTTWALAFFVFATFVGFAFWVDYARGVSSDPGMPLNTAVALTLLTIALIASRPRAGIAAAFASDRVSAALLRRVGPAVLVIPVVVGLIRLEGDRTGLWDLSVGTALFSLATAVGLLAVLALAARRLDEVDHQREMAAAAVVSSEANLSATVESASDGIILLDANGRIRSLNTAAKRIFLRGDELAGTPFSSLLDPEGRERFARGLHEHDGQGVPFAKPTQFTGLREGEPFPLELSLASWRGDGVTNLTAIVRDISERHRVEESLREAEERFRGAFENAPIGMAITNLEGRFLSVNPALCEITGYSREQLEMTTFGGITHPADIGRDLKALRSLLDGEQSLLTGERRWIHRDGHKLPVELTATVVRDGRSGPRHLLVQVQDITERKRFEGQLQYLADHDALTGLFNRRRFEEELSRAIANADRHGDWGAVLALDLDHFKYVNDALGHAAGDELISKVGEVLRGRLRRTDVLGRLGGDEFAVVLPRTEPEAAKSIAADLIRMIREECAITVGGRTRGVSASLGIALFAAGQGMSADELLVEADVAMYDAKEAGRDQFTVYDRADSREEQMQARLTWVERIRDALEFDRFVLHAQPIMALTPDSRPRFELLVRMVGDDGDLIPPGTFLYIAERFDLIREIDRWVARSAIELLAELGRDGKRPILEVNISGKTITDPDLPEFLAEEFRRTGADPRCLCFEATETAAIVNVDRAKAFARSLHELGCEFALDDFGAGFASFYYLKHLEFDYLKIDGEFIRDLPTSRTNQLVVRAVVEIARGLGRSTIAEFVGDHETLTMLRELGVTHAQGFHIGKPVPIAEADFSRPASAQIPPGGTTPAPSEILPRV